MHRDTLFYYFVIDDATCLWYYLYCLRLATNTTYDLLIPDKNATKAPKFLVSSPSPMKISLVERY